MASVRYRFRAELRRTAWSALALVLVVGIGGGLALAALAAARRTTSAYPRMLRATAAPDVLVNPDFGTFSKLDPAKVAALPQVEAGGVGHGLLAAPPDESGEPDIIRDVMVLAATDGLGYETGRPVLRSGRMPDPERADEALVNPDFAAASHLDVGDHFPLLITTFDALQASDDTGRPPRFERVDFEAVGIGLQPDEATVDGAFHQGRLTLTEAFFARHAASEAYWGGFYRLRPGASLREFQAAVQAMVSDESIAFQSTERSSDKFTRGVRPQATALVVFGLVLGLAVLAVGVLGVSRQHAGLAADRDLARVLGGGRVDAVRLGLLHGIILGGGAAGIAVTVALVASRYAPPEPARLIEIDPGLSFDSVVLAPGIAALAATLLLTATIVGGRGARPRPVGVGRRSRFAAWLRSIGAPLPSVMGAQLAFERGAGRAATPVWSSLVGISAGVAVVTGSLIFAASLDRVASTPRLYGTTWDAALFFSLPDGDVSGNEDLDPRKTGVVYDRFIADAADQLRAKDGVEGLSELIFGQIGLGGRTTPAMGIRPMLGVVAPPVVAGRAPANDREIALGRRTMQRIGAGVGDEVDVGEETFTVVGQAVFPGYAEYPGQDKTELGDGALLTGGGLRSVGPVFAGRTMLVDVADGVDARRLLQDFRAEGLIDDSPTTFDTYRPAEIVTLARVRDTPARLAVVLGLLGFALLVHTLVSSVRRRRSVLALLAVLGFTRRQVRAVVLGQASLVGAVALVMGLPLGLVLGRWAWTYLIEHLGGIVSVALPPGGLAVLAALVLVAANVVAVVPARMASRVRPAVALRSE